MWFVFLLCALVHSGCASELTFPPGFKFGAATASYQVEGAWNVSDKSESVWDRYTHTVEGAIADGATGDVACDSYHQWEKDIELAANMSLDFYRFSISWPRIMPTGFPNYISEDGKRYYNNLIDGLLAKGIEPLITIYHWDLPQRLQELGGWANPLITDWYTDFADVAFSLFGDRVKTWLTFNEPVAFCDVAYSEGFNFPPDADDDVAVNLCVKHVLVAHGKAYRLYQEKYKSKFQGNISFATQSLWYEGLTKDDADAGELANQYITGRYTHAVYSKEGGWPPVIEKMLAEKSAAEGHLRSRLPAFTEEEKELVKGTFDFFALNHYTSRGARMARPGEDYVGSIFTGAHDVGVVFESRPEWPSATSTWLQIYPEGFRLLLKWIKDQYGDIPIFITENGYSSMGGQLDDYDRIEYYRLYLEQLLLAMHEDKVNVIGYTAWTLIDNFEWSDGYRSKFGLCEVDFSDPERKRTMRLSAHFYRDVVMKRSLDVGSQYYNDEH